jgi:hypothetical protein
MSDENKPSAPEGKADEDEARRRANMLKAGIGIGIGSAAIVAALLYSSGARRKKGDPTTKAKPPEPKDRD